MTGLALQAAVTEGAARIVRPRVLGAEQPRDRGIVMTAEAGVRSLRTVRRISIRRAISRERLHGPAQQQSKCAGYAGTPKPLHSVRRDRDVVHDFHVSNAPRAVADAAGLRIRRI
jgi:hypothetical protein